MGARTGSTPRRRQQEISVLRKCLSRLGVQLTMLFPSHDYLLSLRLLALRYWRRHGSIPLAEDTARYPAPDRSAAQPAQRPLLAGDRRPTHRARLSAHLFALAQPLRNDCECRTALFDTCLILAGGQTLMEGEIRDRPDRIFVGIRHVGREEGRKCTQAPERIVLWLSCWWASA